MKEVHISWDEVDQLAYGIANKIHQNGMLRHNSMTRIYGVPRGGIPVAVAVHHQLIHKGWHSSLTESAPNADYIVDDIIDSGNTYQKYMTGKVGGPRLPHCKFFALVSKQMSYEGQAAVRAEEDAWVSFPWERMENQSGPEDAVTRLLQFIGEDPTRQGLMDTPARVIKSYKEMFSGYAASLEDVFKTFEESCDEMVVVRGIPFFSTCEHHMLPFHGTADVGYIPAVGKVIGLSKLARLVEVYARRLQVQERLTQQVTRALDLHLKPLGSACVIRAEHLCMSCRGVNKPGAVTVTSSMTGAFRTKPEARAEFFQLAGGS